MKYDLKKPCKNCPFRTDKTAIRFATKERAEEIEESAYRNGFPCHLSAELDEDDEDAGFEAGPNTQHCAGALIMYMQSGETEWPGVDNDDELVSRLWKRLDFKSPVFDSPEAFIAGAVEKRRRR